jgi:hypothetical protein
VTQNLGHKNMQGRYHFRDMSIDRRKLFEIYFNETSCCSEKWTEVQYGEFKCWVPVAK